MSSCTLDYMTPAPAATSVDVRRTVLDAALAIIDTQGPDAVSMREVARQAGVSHQAPYHYFSDRAGIFAAISEEGFLGLTETLQRVYSSTTHSAGDGLRAYVAFAMSHRGHFRVMFRNDICGIATHEPAQHAADNAFNALLELVGHVVEGKPSDEDAMVWATTLWSIAHGVATLVIDGPLVPRLAKHSGPGDVDNYLEAVMDHFDTMVTRQARSLFTK
jgi:AcrR family transcriptional regulator